MSIVHLMAPLNQVKHTDIYPISRQELFSLITKKEAFTRLWTERLDPEFFYRDTILEKGSKTTLQLHFGPLKLQHSFYCTDKNENELLIIKQGIGFFKILSLTFTFKSIEKQSCEFSQLIDFQLPQVAFFSKILANSMKKRLNNFLVKREKRLHKDLYYRNKYPIKDLKVAISGTNGLIGAMLKSFLGMLGAQVFTLSRITSKSNKPNEILYDYNKGTIEVEKLEKLDAVIHLAGEPIRLNPSKTDLLEIEHSRVASTKLIATAINQCKKPAKSFLCASAIGLYPVNTSTIQDEQDQEGNTLLAEICKKWEKSAQICTQARVVNLRFSPVLSPNKGLLKKMMNVAKTGFMPVIGNGLQCTSWISIDDVLYQILHILKTKSLSGAVNICSPNFINQKTLAKTLCNSIRRPQFIRLPKALLTTVLPKFTSELLFSNQKIYPTKLIESGAEFAYPQIENTFSYFFGCTT